MRKNNKRSLVAVWFTFCALIFSLCTGLTDRNARAQSDKAPKPHASAPTQGKKVSSDLRELVGLYWLVLNQVAPNE